MSKEVKPEKSVELQKLPRGVVSIPKGELEDMKRELKRVTRKRRPVKP